MTDKDRKPSTGLAPRRAALRLLQAVLAEGQMLSDAMPGLDALVPADRARAQRLALTVLRNLGRADAVLSPHLAKPPPLKARNVLRLAVVEHFHDHVPVHAAVDTGVRLMRADRKTGRLAKLANAVLRRAVETGAGPWAEAGPERLPGWLRKPLVTAWGKPAVLSIEAAHEAGAPLDLTLKPAAETDALAKALGAARLATGSLRRAAGGQVSEWPGYAEGRWWIQDAAAAIPARCLGAVAGQAVLDLCAAPGGKTMQLAAAGARVTALDISGPRMERVAENLARTGLAAETVVADALDWAPADAPDAILLDAPCTATGTIRRHPDLPHVRKPRDIAALTDLQARLLDRAAGWLAPGGRLVYCTCSLLPAEGEDQIAAALARHPALEQRPLDPSALGLPAEAAAPGGALRLRPDFWAEQGGMDGFYIACLVQG
ncbi:RsmB/NOP family class I SAM-dependent RNA methyltransferase [Rhodovulum sp. YNF3179]|uniref:RsmB/NOP family class I SAM-dependent RNA methyltransferase n=1 Tax=Rhodovulum sp. YNF3179 TaxID=3425127 RepID=UPI003D342746